MISDYLGLERRTEAILIIGIAIVTLCMDDSASKSSSNLKELWNFNFGEEIKERNMERFLKNILAFVMLITSYTSRIFLGFYVVLLWPVISEKKQYLMIPWLVLGFVRSVLVTLLTLTTGTYICLVQKGFNAICLDFLLAQTIDHGPSVYAWVSIYHFYQLMCSKRGVSKGHRMKYSKFPRSRNQEGNFITESTITALIVNLRQPTLLDVPTRSLDSLLTLPSSKIKEKDSGSSISDFVKKTLSISDEDITKAKLKRSYRTLSNASLNAALLKRTSYSCRQKFGKHEDNIRTKFTEDNNKEVELKCVSLEESAYSATIQFTDNFKGDNSKEQGEVKYSDEDSIKDTEGNNFGCQVSTLSRSLFNQSPIKITERFSSIKRTAV
ncbi:uncharacterized protein [Leptinotarsa decemlineata]|uniref:uncharacterized protein n=1 Tax=Leptinotarsa decemlineata TaxID=7539 RepID=UPI003D30590A